MCLGVCAKFYFAMFSKINGCPCHERLREILEDMTLFIGSVLNQKTVFSTMREIILFGNF